jgi:EAL domain-containing protein (putative c-di-GMP-specific phosphodiesterase class I)/ActR/RegA family two-component response regulator
MPRPLASIGTLLVVDDSAVQRAQAISLCRDMGVEMIYEAANGAEALNLLSMLVLPPDLMIVDLEMPDMDGIELIEEMARRQIHVALVVASSRELSLVQAVEAMARNLGLPILGGLQKPLSGESLRGALEKFGALRDAQGGAPRGAPPPDIPRAVLAQAIRDGQIRAHYQPKVDMLTGIVRGVEALARWTHPELGTVRPDHFIAVAEREGLIHELTMSVLETAVAQAAHWNAHGLKLSMAVNLSPRLLETPALAQTIADVLQRHALPAEQVTLELTESSVVDCMGVALGVLARLRLRGIGLSIDDYGTGFSSMQQLARIPFTELKIDRSFVHEAHLRRNLRVILQSALGMSRQLGLVTVAEGIEILEDWRVLQQSGCVIGQGYFISRPLPPEDMLPWLKSHQARLPELRADPSQRAARARDAS